MDDGLVDTVARALQRQYGKEMFGEIQKWEKRTPRERSTWRLIARLAIDLVHKAGDAPPPKAMATSAVGAAQRNRRPRPNPASTVR